MIPTLIAFGLVAGRWWRSCLAVAAVGWPVLLVTTDVKAMGPGLLAAAGLAVANTGLGVLAHQGIQRLVRKLRRVSSSYSDTRSR